MSKDFTTVIEDLIWDSLEKGACSDDEIYAYVKTRADIELAALKVVIDKIAQEVMGMA